MKIVNRTINEIIPYKNNAKKHDKKQIANVAESIRQYGFVQPVVIDAEGVIVIGHCRVLAAKKLGLKEVPCVCVDELTPEQVNTLRIVDNKSNESEWDIELLAAELPELDLSGFEFDFNLPEEKQTADVIEDAIPEVDENAEPVTKLGDIWQLGKHRLMCGDSTDKATVELLMDGKKADMVFTDPPYGIDYSGGRTQVVNTKDYGKLKNDNLQGEALGNLICNVFKYNKAEADVYICVSPIMQKPFLDYIAEEGKRINAVIVWDKKQPGLGYMAYRRQCEFILFVKGKPFKKGDASDFDLWSISRDDATSYVHGTQKPVGVSARAINNSCKKDDLVLDLFGGSGSTLIACEQLVRTCYMMELDPKYCDVIIKRWENLTGEKAVLLGE